MKTILTKFVTTDAEKSAALQVLFHELSQEAPAEPGHISYQVFASATDPLVYFVLDSWQSQAYVDQHSQRVEQAGYWEKAIQLLAFPPENHILVSIQA